MRLLGRASLSLTTTPILGDRTTPILNDSYGALRYRTPQTQTAIAHNPNFKRSPIFLD
ncbi:MAG: hypothetical protein WCO29_01510 [Nostocales cyanobacterium ELA583]